MSLLGALCIGIGGKEIWLGTEKTDLIKGGELGVCKECHIASLAEQNNKYRAIRYIEWWGSVTYASAQRPISAIYP